MPNVRLYDYYGVSFPMLLTSTEDVVNEVIHCATSWSGIRLLNSLYIEGKILKHELYQSGRFTYVTDEDSVQAKNLIKYVDFYTAYRKYSADAANAQVPITAGSLESDSIEAPAGLDSSDDLFAFSADESTSDLEDLAVDSGASDTELDLEALAVDRGADFDFDYLDEAPSLDLEDLAEESLQPAELAFEGMQEDANSRILEELSYDRSFYASFSGNDYAKVLPFIANWSPATFKHLKDLRELYKDFSGLGNMIQIVDNLKATLHELEEQLSDQSVTGVNRELLELRIKTCKSEISSKEEIISQNSTRFEFFDDGLREVINRELQLIPTKLHRQCKSVDGKDYGLSEVEYTILSKLHEQCSSVSGGYSKIDWILLSLQECLRAGTSGTKRFLNMEFSVLSSKETRAQLIIFNKRYKEMLRNYSGTDLVRVLSEGMQDCATLTGAGSEGEKVDLQSLFRQVPGGGKSEKTLLRGRSALSEVMKKIMSSQSLVNKMSIGGEPVDEELLKQMLLSFMQTVQVLEIAESEETFAAAYKIWHFINRNSVYSVLNKMGIFEDVKLETLRKLHSVFGIPGFYTEPQKFFYRACKVGANVAIGKDVVIDKNKRKNLYENLRILHKYLESSREMHMGTFPLMEFERDSA